MLPILIALQYLLQHFGHMTYMLWCAITSLHTSHSFGVQLFQEFNLPLKNTERILQHLRTTGKRSIQTSVGEEYSYRSVL